MLDLNVFNILIRICLVSIFILPVVSVCSASGPIPVIYDSDIGDDIDDTWALGLLLKSPELDVKLVVGDQGKTIYRAKLLAKMLERAGRADIPVGIGLDINASGGGRQSEWVEDYNLNDYPGTVYPDGVRAIIDIIMSSVEPVTIIAVGPLPNIARALELEPRISQKARFVGMHGSVRLGYKGKKGVSAEYNVRADVSACRTVFSADWPITITPLDTCGFIHLTGDKYQRVLRSDDPVAKAIIENYRIWSHVPAKNNKRKGYSDTRSSTLFDTAAVYLAIRQDLMQMEKLGIRVTDDGYTKIDPSAKMMNVATAWKDMDSFEDFIVKRLTKELARNPSPRF